MKQMKLWQMQRVMFGLLVFFLGGCVTKPSAPTNFYMLNPLSKAEIKLKFAERDRYTIVGVGPVQFPAYLDRPQFIIRESENKYRLAEFDHWAEPLQSNVERVFLENLNIFLNDVPIAVVQLDSYMRTDYALRMRVIRMESDDGGNVSLDAGWVILGDEGEKVITAKVSNYRVRSKSTAYQDIAAAQSQALDSLSREIADTIKTLSR
jgi:uncharacterized lipoprotein YmbA